MAFVDLVAPAEPPQKVRRHRRRRRSDNIDRQEIFDRVKTFYDDDVSARAEDIEARIQRYAKYRMWTEGKDWPWPDSSDAAVPDMMSHSGRLQDTIHNAVMQRRPVIGSHATDENDNEKQRHVDNLLDYQFFTDQQGEETVGELAEAFINDGVFYAFVPWVDEKREVHKVRVFDPIPLDMAPADYFRAILQKEYPSGQFVPEDTMDPWDWEVTDDRGSFRARFYTRGQSDEAEVELLTEREVTVFDGPRVLSKDYSDVLYPAEAGNLQPPGPSNPLGATHVILRDKLTVDEIRRLAGQGFYDLLTAEDLEHLESLHEDTTDKQESEQKTTMRGQSSLTNTDKARSHRKLTRLICFDQFDVDGDGKDEQVVWWVILEAKRLARFRLLSEVFPLDPPMRPVVSKSLFPVRGRVAGISLLEMMEGLHDLLKSMVDQTVDYGTLRNVPFFFYRASGTMKPETLRMHPGEGYPLGDPQRDVNMPQFQSGDPSFGINMMTMVNQFEERLTMVGDFQFGRVPAGKSSALRTVGGMSMLAGQGEARPERILRRFFSGLSDVWKLMHGLNQAFLPAEKKIRIMGPLPPNENPFQNVKRDDISGVYLFDFDANILNTSRMAMQESIERLMQVYVSDLAIQLGITTPDGMYRMFRDFARALGQDPDQYISPPSPMANKRLLSAEDAILQISHSQTPDGAPMEGAQGHLEKLMEFMQSDDFGILQPNQVDLFRDWLTQIASLIQQEAQQAQLAQAAQQFQAGGQDPGGRPATQPPPSMDNPQVNNELLDESMPGAGGGAVQ